MERRISGAGDTTALPPKVDISTAAVTLISLAVPESPAQRDPGPNRCGGCGRQDASHGHHKNKLDWAARPGYLVGGLCSVSRSTPSVCNA